MKQVKIGRFELARRFGAIFQNRFKHDSRAQSSFDKVLRWALFMTQNLRLKLVWSSWSAKDQLRLHYFFYYFIYCVNSRLLCVRRILLSFDSIVSLRSFLTQTKKTKRSKTVWALVEITKGGKNDSVNKCFFSQTGNFLKQLFCQPKCICCNISYRDSSTQDLYIMALIGQDFAQKKRPMIVIMS